MLRIMSYNPFAKSLHPSIIIQQEFHTIETSLIPLIGVSKHMTESRFSHSNPITIANNMEMKKYDKPV